eukprot:607794_1
MIHFVLFALSLHHICIQSSSSTTKTCYDVWNHFTLSQKADALTNQTDVYTLSNNVSVRCSFVDLGDNTSFIGALSEYGSLANHNTSLRCIMTQDCPFNQYDLETGESLKLYRWSLDRIISYRNHSIYHSFDEQPYLFMTCNRNLTLIKDYMLMPFHEDFVNATLTLHKACYHIKQANIRGYQCKDDVGNFWSEGHFHTQSSSCFCGGCCSWQSGAVYSEDHFGWYKFTNPLFSCTADSGSTTDYWIGSIVKVNLEPTSYPTIDPTTDPTIDTTSPSATPSEAPSDAPTAAPTSVSAAPSYSPTVVPTITPTRFPSDTPTHPPTSPTDTPSASPTKAPSNDPTTHPSLSPSRAPSLAPTLAPSMSPSMAPSNAPSLAPTLAPSVDPSTSPSNVPSSVPTLTPSGAPSMAPSHAPSSTPTLAPSVAPSMAPSNAPSLVPSLAPTVAPSMSPSDAPTTPPTIAPTISPTNAPSLAPTFAPSKPPSNAPSLAPTLAPSMSPSMAPSNAPTTPPTIAPTISPTNAPSLAPTFAPSKPPSNAPSLAPTLAPSVAPSMAPSNAPSLAPTLAPSVDPSTSPSNVPSSVPTLTPSGAPSMAPSHAPSSTPTLAPSVAPSIAPSHAPSSAPTLAPSVAPSIAPLVPTLAPSVAPSIAPSNAPSLAPTLAPSVAPSMAPSNAPTTPPTIAPTNPPTNAPSLAPSQSPTACVDYFNYTSLDGIDVLNDVTPHNHAFPLDAAVQKHIPTTNDHFVRETILCDNNDAKDENICFIGCYQVGLCALSSIECAPNTIWKEIRVVCTEDVCLYLNVNITDTTVDTLTILCDGRFACDGLQLTINAASNIDVSVDCNEAFSCNDMVIHLMHDPDKDASDDDINVDITCYADSSCDGALITTDHSENIYINLNALRYSDDIRILHHFWRNIKVNCAFNGDRRYIRYDTDNLLRNYEILELARDEYRQRKLPCEDIKIYCSNNEHFERECEYKYALHNISSSDILNGEAKPNCYWLEIGQLYKATCKGTCGDQMIYTKYNKTFALSFYLGGNQDTDDDDDDEQRRRRLQGNTDQNMTNLTESYRTCDEYFGTINATDDSLSSIDAIYADVLNVMISFDDFVIHDILSPPYTILQNGLEQIECTNEGANTVSIMTNVTIESAESTEAVIGRVFASDGLFINKSAAFLSKFFGIPITILSPDEVHVLNVSQGFSTSVIIAIVLSAFFVIIGILFFVFKSYKKREREKEELTTYVRNPLVLFVGISQYDEAPTNPQVDGFFRSLDGIDVDARNVNRLFGDQLNYTVFPKDSQLKWSGEQLMAFLTEKADLLESNVRTIYDGLVVILSCHGITDHIVTSDYKTIKKSAVHRLFTAQKPKSREIPRVFIFDCCDGADTREAGVLRDEEESDEEQLKAVVKPENPGHVALASDQYPVRPKREGLRKVDSAKNIERALSTNAGTAGSWLEEEKNPDYQLITIYAANEGFQSKLDIHKGSYVITEFVERMSQNVENGNQKWIFEVFDEIQSVLHRKGKQLTDNKYNNNMRYLKFMRNDDGNDQAHNVLNVDSDSGNDEVMIGLSDMTHDQTKGGERIAQVDGTCPVIDCDLKNILLPQPDSKLDLSEYFVKLFNAAYRDNASLCGLNKGQLNELGIVKPFHQKVLLGRIKQLEDEEVELQAITQTKGPNSSQDEAKDEDTVDEAED